MFTASGLILEHWRLGRRWQRGRETNGTCDRTSFVDRDGFIGRRPVLIEAGTTTTVELELTAPEDAEREPS